MFPFSLIRDCDILMKICWFVGCEIVPNTKKLLICLKILLFACSSSKHLEIMLSPSKRKLAFSIFTILYSYPRKLLWVLSCSDIMQKSWNHDTYNLHMKCIMILSHCVFKGHALLDYRLWWSQKWLFFMKVYANLEHCILCNSTLRDLTRSTMKSLNQFI